MDKAEMIRKSMMRDMSEGVMAIGLDGLISYVNPAAADILGYEEKVLNGQRFGSIFFEYEENDAFTQAVLDAVYDTTVSHRNVVPYYDGSRVKQLHITTSYLRSGQERIGVIAVISDISELSELRDAVRAMERIKALNGQLALRNQLLSETFGRFLSDEIVRQLLDTPDGLALGGKKRMLTVMMSDLRGFTAMSERMAADGLLSMLNHYLGKMTEIIQKHNGTIIEFIGDGIMAIFGAPAASGRHASEAVAAAVEMQIEMKEINEWNERHGYPLLEMGIGLNTGEMIVGNIGSEKRTKYGVVGQNVNLCGRIESYTVGGQVLISQRTREAVLEPLEIEHEMQVLPKGVKEPMTIFHVTGIGGEYQISCRREEELPALLDTPRDIVFYMVQDKHSDQKPGYGRLTAISERGAVIETDVRADNFANIWMEAGGKLFGKVISQKGRQWRVHFTARPLGFAGWLEQMRENTGG